MEHPFWSSYALDVRYVAGAMDGFSHKQLPAIGSLLRRFCTGFAFLWLIALQQYSL
jgi:hypothetical protein